MVIACEYGPATYFITVTASPCWEELQAALLPGQNPQIVLTWWSESFIESLPCSSSISSLYLGNKWHVYMSLSTKNGVFLILIQEKATHPCLLPYHSLDF